MVKFTHLISKGDKNKCYVKFVFGEVFKNSIKLLISPLLVMLQTFYSKSTQRQIGYSSTQSTFLADSANS